MINIPAFELLRKHKTVSSETEALVRKVVKNRVSSEELFNIFEDGISGKYGKLYAADPQTLIGWVEEYLKNKNNNRNYLASSLALTSMSEHENWDWKKEANKCYAAFLNGVSETNFHHCVYDELMISGRIEIGSYEKYYDGPPISDVNPADQLRWMEVLSCVRNAMRKVLKDVFSEYRSLGYSTVFFIR